MPTTFPEFAELLQKSINSWSATLKLLPALACLYVHVFSSFPKLSVKPFPRVILAMFPQGLVAFCSVQSFGSCLCVLGVSEPKGPLIQNPNSLKPDKKS